MEGAVVDGNGLLPTGRHNEVSVHAHTPPSQQSATVLHDTSFTLQTMKSHTQTTETTSGSKTKNGKRFVWMVKKSSRDLGGAQKTNQMFKQEGNKHKALKGCVELVVREEGISA